MRWFTNLKIKTKLLSGFILVAVFALVVGTVGFVNLTQSITRAGELHEYISAVDSLDRVLVNVGKINTDLYRLAQAVDGGVQGDVDTATASIDSLMGEVDAALAEYESTAYDEETEKDFYHSKEVFEGTFADYIATVEQTAQTGDAAALYTVIEDGQDVYRELETAIDQTAQTNAAWSVEELETNRSIGTSASIIQVVVAAAAFVISLVLAFYISGIISRPVKDMMGYIKQAGETGNLQFHDDEWANCDRLSLAKDETGQTMKAFTQMMRKFVYYGQQLNRVADRDLTVSVDTLGPNDTFGGAIVQMVDNLNGIFLEISTSTEQVATGSGQIANAASALAQGSTQQAATVQQLSASVGEIADKTRKNAETAEKAASLSNEIMQNAAKGSQQMDEMITAVGEINEASKNISTIIKAIDDIAFQTNILALNAAVEAARAGEQGKGFAVVADEVRSLAGKSAEAAKETGNMIQQTMDKAAMGSRIADDTAASLAQIVSGINESSLLMGEIAQSSEEQSSGIGEINTGIDQVAQVVQENSATAEQSAAASEEMSGQAELLERLVAQFSLRGAGSRKALPPGGL